MLRLWRCVAHPPPRFYDMIGSKFRKLYHVQGPNTVTMVAKSLSAKGLGLRSGRFSMLIKDGELKVLNVEEPGKFVVSDVDTLLGQAKAL